MRGIVLRILTPQSIPYDTPEKRYECLSNTRSKNKNCKKAYSSFQHKRTQKTTNMQITFFVYLLSTFQASYCRFQLHLRLISFFTSLSVLCVSTVGFPYSSHAASHAPNEASNVTLLNPVPLVDNDATQSH